jgi:hypothetical protein
MYLSTELKPTRKLSVPTQIHAYFSFNDYLFIDSNTQTTKNTSYQIHMFWVSLHETDKSTIGGHA